ncbi:hypothetical protein PIB30_018986 [Stylosanthes scabra]|uniref:Uncharacterized protein n=1 Tax=Stylosanthes scabra TaxID=79078 RepID=A0ABU6Q817_9FABA|nr:hypothetical protein [Stylosanthes scabra]
MSSPGFVGLFLAKDVPADNKIGPVFYDEELFATEYVTCVGQCYSLITPITFFGSIPRTLRSASPRKEHFLSLIPIVYFLSRLRSIGSLFSTSVLNIGTVCGDRTLESSFETKAEPPSRRWWTPNSTITSQTETSRSLPPRRG